MVKLAAAVSLSICLSAVMVLAQETPTPTPTPDQLAVVCPKIQVLRGPVLYKAQASAHIGDPRMSRSTTLIFGKRWPTVPAYACMDAYNKYGQKIHRLGMYAKNEYQYRARYYGGWTCGDAKTPVQIRKLADGGPLYFKISKTTCLSIPNRGITGRVGSIY